MLCQVCGPGLGIAPVEADGEHPPEDDLLDADDPGNPEEDAEDQQQGHVTEAVTPKLGKDPGLPTQQEREVHRATHLPYRAWCEECVMASKANPGHKTVAKETPEVPEVGVDYGFLREEGQEGSLTMMVVKDRESRATFTFMVPSKGAGWKYSVDCLQDAIERLGHTKIVLMHDQEAALNDLCKEAAKSSKCDVLQQSPPVGESQANGRIEVAVKLSKNQVRAIKFGLERRLRCKIPQDHPIMGFLVEHAGMLLTKFQMGRDDGKTAYRRLLGKDCREEAIEFGESVLYRQSKIDTSSLDKKWQIGIFLGRRWGTGECYIGTGEGVHKCRGIQRRPSDVRWDKQAVEALVGTPWCMEPKPGEDARVYMPDELFDPQPPEASEEGPKEKAPQRLRITRDDVLKYKFTQGCKKCADIARGRRTRATHSKPCRDRIEEEMKKDPIDRVRIREANARLDDYCVRAAQGVQPATPHLPPDAEPTEQPPQDGEEEGPDQRTRTPPESDEDDDATIDLENADEGDDIHEGADYMRISAVEFNSTPILDTLRNVPEGNELERSLAALGCSNGEIKAMLTEVYSEPRMTKMAPKLKSLNIVGGKSYDLKKDKNGNSWDFSKAADRRRARKEIAEDKPELVVGSPPCTDCSILNRLWNFPKMDPKEVIRRRTMASVHLSFCCQIYLDQVKAGRYFLHEHPASADSWSHPGVTYVAKQLGVDIVKSDMCQFGMQARADDGSTRLVLKPTKWMSNSRCILRRLARRCPCRKGGGASKVPTMSILKEKEEMSSPKARVRRTGSSTGPEDRQTQLQYPKVQIRRTRSSTGPEGLQSAMLPKKLRSQTHLHTPLLGGKASAAQEYPADLCIEVIRGLRNQMDEDRKSKNMMNSLGMECGEEQQNLEQDIHHPKENGKYVDDITGHTLDRNLVQEARAEEVRFLRERKIYEKVPIAEAWTVTGRAPIGGRWVDHDKGSDGIHDVRSRYVAKDYNNGQQEGLFAAMPPLEAKRMLFSHVATNRRQGREAVEISFIDARKAYYNAKPARPVYVALPPEDGQPGMCAKLNWCMYGTREAASRWTETYTKILQGLGFVRGKASTCIFYHPVRQLRLVVHGDDFTTSGTRAELDWLEKEIAASFEIKVRGRLGDRDGCDKEVKILNRIVRWTNAGLTYEADPQHVQTLLRELKLETAAGRASPGAKEEDEGKDGSPLSPTETTRFRALAARANYLAQDRPDIAFACKEVCRRMSSPCEADWAKVKRLVRYLRDNPTCTYKYSWQRSTEDNCMVADIYVDTDFAGCKRTRRSTSGGMCFLGDHLVRQWSSTQKTIALSSGEAELHGIVRGATEALALRSLGWDMGISVSLVVHTDSSAAKGIAERDGIGRVRHLEVGVLWIQEKLKAGDFRLRKVLGTKNPADLLTKHLAGPDISKHLASANLFR